MSERFGSARDFPADVAGLRGLAAVMIADFDSASLAPEQLDALRAFFDLGGNLVVAGGAAWERTVVPLTDDPASPPPPSRRWPTSPP